MTKNIANKSKNKANTITNNSAINVIGNFFYLHKICVIDSIKRLAFNPLSCTLTCTVMAIALVLPAMLNLILGNFARLSEGVNETGQISIYLKMETKLEDAEQLKIQISDMFEVKNVLLINAEQALEQFQQFSGMNNILQQLPFNPLPISLQVIPKDIQHSTLHELYQKLQNMPYVEQVKLDLEWIERLNALLALSEQCVFALTIMLLVALLLIVGNTIRLHIENYQHEIEVMLLVGASYAYIRRPFVYVGAMYGLIAGILAWVFVAYGLHWLNNGVVALAKLYGSDFMLNNITTEQGIYLVCGAVMLGFIGAWFATTRYLSKFKLK